MAGAASGPIPARASTTPGSPRRSASTNSGTAALAPRPDASEGPGRLRVVSAGAVAQGPDPLVGRLAVEGSWLLGRGWVDPANGHERGDSHRDRPTPHR